MHYLTFDLGVKVTWSIAQYHLRHVIYASAKFEVAKTNGLGEDTITTNVMDMRTDRRTDRRTTVQNLYTILFLRKSAGYEKRRHV